MAYSFDDYKSGRKPPKGWDAADALSDGWTKTEVFDFLRGTVELVEDQAEPDPEDDQDDLDPLPVNSGDVIDIKTGKPLVPRELWSSMMLQDMKGVIKNSAANCAVLLEYEPRMQGVIQYNDFARVLWIMKQPPWDRSHEFEPRPIADTDYTGAAHWLEQDPHRMKPPASQVPGMFAKIGADNSFDPLSEYLTGLKWDGVERVRDFLPRYFGTPTDTYTKAISLRFMVSAVARAMRPGCKADTMMIIEGPQGLQKSTAVKALFGPEYYTDGMSVIGSKDAQMEQGGVWGIEVAEMHRMSSAEVNNVKHFLSVSIDRFRPPYGKSIVEMPRRSLMVGTMNPEGNPYLRDQTGARRFWPVESGIIDIVSLVQDRDQLWAEAMVLLEQGVPWWVQHDEQTAVEREQELRTTVDAWTDAIAAEVTGKKRVSQSDIIMKLGIALKDVDYKHTDRVGRIMKRLGWEREKNPSGRVTYVYKNW